MNDVSVNDLITTASNVSRVDLSTFGSIEVPVDHRTTVESRVGVPLIFRLIFGYTVVAVTGGPALNDVVAATDNTFDKYSDFGAEWAAGDADAELETDGTTRRVIREFTWVENDYLAMSSVVMCISDESRSMIVHGSCATRVGEAELADLRRVVESARLP